MTTMNHEEARQPAAFKPFAPENDKDPNPMLARLREEAPVMYWDQGRCWLMARYDDIVAVLRDPRFTTDRAAWEHAGNEEVMVRSREMEELNRRGLFALGATDHARVRRLVSPSFTPRATERLRPVVQRIVDEALEAAPPGDVLDVARDFAEHIPVRVISAMLNIPRDRERGFHRFASAAIRDIFPNLIPREEVDDHLAALREGIASVGEVIDERRRNPIEGDILTSLIQAEEQGDRLNKAELLSLVVGMIVAGSETTVHLIAFSVLNLLRRPALVAQIQAEPELLKGAVEEVLRFDFFGKLGITRYALTDAEIGGAHIKKGQMVMLLLGSGLRDGIAFPDADTFDPRRETGGSIGFGNGAHYCLGANLARLEAVVAVGTLLQRFPGMQLEGTPVFAPHPTIRKMDSLKVRLRPAAS